MQVIHQLSHDRWDHEHERFENQNGELKASAIVLEEVVGRGRSTNVYRACLDGQHVAVKCFGINSSRPEDRKRALQQDFKTMIRISHPNLVRLIGFTIQPVQIVSEFCVGGCLFELLHNADHIEMRMAQQLKMASDVANGMDFLHKLDPPIVHKKLNSTNLLLTEPVLSESDVPRVKVSSFGLSHWQEVWQEVWQQDWGRRRICAEALHWIAPEILNTSVHDEKSDIYSYSMILFELVCREIPFEDEEPARVFRLMLNGARPDLEAVPPDCPKEFCNLMINCWEHNPEVRPVFQQCSEVLAPMMVSMVITLYLERGGTRVSCLSLGGDELLGVEIHDANTQKIGEIRCKINKSIVSAHCMGQPRLVLPSGQLVDCKCDDKTVAELLV